MHVLVVEDDVKIARYLKRGLEEADYAVDLAHSGQQALDWVETVDFDFIIMDILLPEIDGITVCRTLRSRDVRTPIIMLTARDAIHDRVIGLDAGADDYLIKPFALEELFARLRALSRRTLDAPKTGILQIANLRLDTQTRQVERGGIGIKLTTKEFAILEYLMRKKGSVLTREAIADHVWNYGVFHESNVVDVYIRNLRRKIDDGFDDKLIYTIRGVGYKMGEALMDE